MLTRSTVGWSSHHSSTEKDVGVVGVGAVCWFVGRGQVLSHIADRAKEEEISVETFLALSLPTSPCVCVCFALSHTPLPLLPRMCCCRYASSGLGVQGHKGVGKQGVIHTPSPLILVVMAHGFHPSSDHC